MDVGEVHARRGNVEQLLAVSGDRIGQVDDVEDLGAAEAGDLDGSHAGEPVAGPLASGKTTACSRQK